MNDSPPRPALMLPGGGARGAYQVGVLKAMAEYLPGPETPFRIIAGTSAGGINAAVMASHAENFAYGAERLAQFWGNFRCRHIYRTGWLHNMGTGLHWLASMTLGGLGIANPKALLDNRPLGQLLERELDTKGIRRAIDEGHLDALLITASGYATSRAVTFFQGRDEFVEWNRYKRAGVRCAIDAGHLLASAALPLLFPAQRIGNEYFGDGGMRHTTPLSPPIHMGADRVVIIGTRDELQDPEPEVCERYPTLGDIGGYLLDVIFMDYLNNDLSRLKRINRTLEVVPAQHRPETGLKKIDALLIQPSEDLREVSNRHMHRVPASVKTLLKGVGAWGPGRLPSYLLFEAEFCRELMELGYKDGMARRDEVRKLMGVSG
ncbi:MAG TPA: patatin-like phospholipase family protein [Wenzhouxiangellaceae bacterium]|nr:patatin-like phospholipase family protein [Wenzhouxiangellaceae bacterium]